MKHATFVPIGPMDIRLRLRIMTLNVGSFTANKKLIECYLNDNYVHVAIITEANVTQEKLLMSP